MKLVDQIMLKDIETSEGRFNAMQWLLRNHKNPFALQDYRKILHVGQTLKNIDKFGCSYVSVPKSVITKFE